MCARTIQPAQKSPFVYAQNSQSENNSQQFFHASSPPPSYIDSDIPLSERLIKAHSEMALPVVSSAGMAASQEPDSPMSRLKSRSLEPLSGLAMWSSEPVVIELQKGDRGLGFSILDYQVRQAQY